MYSVHIAEVISYILSFSSKIILLLPHFLIVHPLQRLDQCFERIERTCESDPVRLTTLSFLLSFLSSHHHSSLVLSGHHS